jgi:SAM-dependent methyltransferase
MDDRGKQPPRSPDDITLREAYDDYPRVEEAFQQFLDGSLNPRGPDSLFEVLDSLQLQANGVGVDVGCGEGRDAIQLARRFGLRVYGVDPLPRHIELSSLLAHAEGLSDAVEFRLGSAEHLPLPDGTADLVWCKEVLMFTQLDRAFGELVRILRPDGIGCVYQVLTGSRMSEAEAREFWEMDLGYGHARSLRPSDIEAAIASAGLQLQRRIDFASEWGEYAQEQTGAGGRRLVHAARLLRDPKRYAAEFGEVAYRIMLADCLWHVYRMIGKLHGAAFIFTKPASASVTSG